MTPSDAARWRYAFHRGLAFGMAIALHLAVLILITRPVADDEDKEPTSLQSRQALQLRFIQRLKPPESRVQVRTRTSVTAFRQARTSRAAAVTGANSHAARASAPSAPAPDAPASGVATPASPPASAAADGDGGFSSQLRNAQHAHSVGALPGSDPPRVSGIQLIDPRTRGVGAVMRQAQRLFGVTNHHCIDIDAWRSMTPQQLLARHISPSDVDKVDAENQCNRPMGLSF